jgi:hypothetical protein
LSATMALNTYNGDVPISPKMMPRVTKSPAMDTFDNLL